MNFPDQLKINDKLCKVNFSRIQNGWTYFFEWGKDISGRMCKIGEHSLPSHILANKRFKIKTGGNTYERVSL
jgi:hypothetical protein